MAQSSLLLRVYLKFFALNFSGELPDTACAPQLTQIAFKVQDMCHSFADFDRTWLVIRELILCAEFMDSSDEVGRKNMICAISTL